jgi:hypothetical protein
VLTKLSGLRSRLTSSQKIWNICGKEQMNRQPNLYVGGQGVPKARSAQCNRILQYNIMDCHMAFHFCLRTFRDIPCTQPDSLIADAKESCCRRPSIGGMTIFPFRHCQCDGQPLLSSCGLLWGGPEVHEGMGWGTGLKGEGVIRHRYGCPYPPWR